MNQSDCKCNLFLMFTSNQGVSTQRASRQSHGVACWVLAACIIIHSIPGHCLVPPSSHSTTRIAQSPRFSKLSPVHPTSQSTRTSHEQVTRATISDAAGNTKMIEPVQDSFVVYFGVDADSSGAHRRCAFFFMACAATGLMSVAGGSDIPLAHAVVDGSIAATATAATTTTIEWHDIFQTAGKRALGGGTAGASAAVVQVCTLMWLRTSMNYQYRYGGTLSSSLQTLWAEGGIGRLYQGLPFALVQGPLTRFGDTAANVGVLAALEALDSTRDWPLPLKTAVGSIAAGLWRIVLMPIDASKTALQVEGPVGLTKLWSNSNASPSKLYQGALAQAAATAVGHFPWFLTYNAIDAQLPLAPSDNVVLQLSRSAILGFSASCVSDCCSNSLRVIKTTKQTAQLIQSDAKELSYPQVVKMIVETDGVKGLFLRGLQTRLLTNAIQGAVFSILWKYFQSTNQ
jgi:Mitochondrial carrier protein